MRPLSGLKNADIFLISPHKKIFTKSLIVVPIMEALLTACFHGEIKKKKKKKKKIQYGYPLILADVIKMYIFSYFCMNFFIVYSWRNKEKSVYFCVFFLFVFLLKKGPCL